MERLQLEKDCSDFKQDVLKRLKRVEGQVKGVQKMVEGDQSCVDILTQVAAVRAAINKVGGLILERQSKNCLKEVIGNSENGNKAIEDLIDTVQKFLRFVD